MISVEEGSKLIEEHTEVLSTEVRKVDESVIGYVIAEKVTAQEPVPGYRASIVDGYAVKGKANTKYGAKCSTTDTNLT